MVDPSDFDMEIADGAAPEALRGLGVWRRPGFLAPAAATRLAEAAASSPRWRRSADYETAPAPAAAAAAFTAGLAMLGLTLTGAPKLIRHRPGGHGAPAAQGGVACLLDLVDGWASQDGGLLLLTEPEGSVHGWRPEAGALTLYLEGRTPLLTMLAPTAPPRYALFAHARAL